MYSITLVKEWAISFSNRANRPIVAARLPSAIYNHSISSELACKRLSRLCGQDFSEKILQDG
jgi:hypothetical protein